MIGEAEPVAEMALPRAKPQRQLPGAVRALIAARAAAISPAVTAAA